MKASYLLITGITAIFIVAFVPGALAALQPYDRIWNVGCRSASMYPVISCGDTVYTKFMPDYRVGDIVIIPTAKYPALDNPQHYAWFVHEVVRKTPQGIVTKGFNNPEDDGVYIREKDVLGKVVKVVKP